MKKFLMSLMLIFAASASHAAPLPVQKLSRGVENIVSSPVEVVKQTRAYWIMGSAKTYHISAWIFCGLVKGLVMTVARAGSGFWDVISFPFPLPKAFQPLLKPDFVLQDWPKREPGIVYKQLGQK